MFQDSDGDKSDDLVVDVSNEVSLGSVSAGPPSNSCLQAEPGEPSLMLGVQTVSLVSQDPATPRVSPAHSPPENGLDKARGLKKGDAPNSPASVASSSSTPSSKTKDLSHVRPSLRWVRPCQLWMLVAEPHPFFFFHPFSI